MFDPVEFFHIENKPVINRKEADQLRGFLNANPHLRSQKDQEQFKNALGLIARLYGPRKEPTGEYSVSHGLEVMTILAELQVDAPTMVTAFLHELVSDAENEIACIAGELGAEVNGIINELRKVSRLEYIRPEKEEEIEEQADAFRKLLLSVTEDLRVILVYLADQLHTIKHVGILTENDRKKLAYSALDVYAPLAHRLGIGRIKWELEDLALKILEPDSYKKISTRIASTRDSREESIKRIIAPLQMRFKEEGIKARVFGRVKHFYSIHNKLQKRKRTFDEILDLLAVRVIVDTTKECYHVLGIVHSLYEPMLNYFSDYIANPKSNMYQSLHTKVKDLTGHVVEVQIRTHEMDLIAEYGLAAHWKYKEGYGVAKQRDLLGDYFRGVRQLLNGQNGESDQKPIDLKSLDPFSKQLFVFTPKGKLIQLPMGATPVDFAFSIHTQVGLSLQGAKVNDRLVPLNTELAKCDIVEVITSNRAKPSLDWLGFVKSKRAKNKIRNYFRKVQFEDSARRGEENLRKEFARRRLKLTEKELEKTAQRFGYDSDQAFFAAIGQGDVQVQNVIQRIQALQQKSMAPYPAHGKEYHTAQKHDIQKGVQVVGADNLLISFGSCCNPIPGDPIIGYISKNRGVVIHRKKCANVKRKNLDHARLVDVRWAMEEGFHFHVTLHILANERHDLLHDLSEAIQKAGVNIAEVRMKSVDRFAAGHLVVDVNSLAQLTSVTNRIRRVKSVIRVDREGTKFH